MEKDKLIRQLKQGTYYYNKLGLFIKSPVTNIVMYDNEGLGVDFAYEAVDIYLDTIKVIKNPPGVIKSFEWCYMLKNYYDEVIGYIGKEVE